jgi:tmRNA-binding protein
MKTKIREGQFEVIDSFVIRRRNEFYLIGQMKDGTVKERWFINVPLNGQLSLTLRISNIEDIEITSEVNKKYTLLVVTGDNETLDLLLGLNIGSELLNITIDGKD